MDKRALYWQSYKRIEKEILDLSDIVYITDKGYGEQNNAGIDQLMTYSNHISDLLVRCAIEVESLMKFLYSFLRDQLSQVEKAKWPDITSKRDYFDKTYFKLIDKVFNLKTKAVYIYNTTFELSDNKIVPYSDENFKGDNGWNKAYNAVKHDRYENLQKGNIKNLLNAAAALYLLNIYSRDVHFDINKDTDLNSIYDFGSEIFAVAAPRISQKSLNNYEQFVSIWEIECPLIVCYTNENYCRVKESEEYCESQLIRYIKSCSELRDEFFLVKYKNKLDPFRVSLTDITNYRKHNLKNIKNFDEKKDKLLHSEEWLYLANIENMTGIYSDLINEDNINHVIDDIESTFADRKTYSLYNQTLEDRVNKIPLTIGLYGSFGFDKDFGKNSDADHMTEKWFD